MSATRELAQMVQKTNDRMIQIEQKIEKIGNSRSSGGDLGTDMLRMALQSGGAKNKSFGAIGYDGADTLSLLNYTTGGRMKGLGMGSYLEDIYAANGGQGTLKIEAARQRIEKHWKCIPIQKTALAEQSGITGGYTVPVQFYAELMRELAEESWLRQKATTLPMQSRTMLIPALTQSGTPSGASSAFFGGISASFQSGEGVASTETEPTFRQIELVARDLVFHTIASNQLLQDNAVALDTMLTTLFKEAMLHFVEWYMINGNAVNQPRGVLGAPATVSVPRATASRVKLVDIAKMKSRLIVNSWKNACWAMNPSVLPELIQMADSDNGRLVWLNQMGGNRDGGGASAPLPTMVLGLPVYWTEKLPYLGTRGDVMLLDPSKIVFGDRMALQIDVSPHVKFIENQMVWRVIQRFDSKPWLDAPITLQSGTITVSPFVALDDAP
jgi:HK97 family phage major capsid protein